MKFDCSILKFFFLPLILSTGLRAGIATSNSTLLPYPNKSFFTAPHLPVPVRQTFTATSLLRPLVNEVQKNSLLTMSLELCNYLMGRTIRSMLEEAKNNLKDDRPETVFAYLESRRDALLYLKTLVIPRCPLLSTMYNMVSSVALSSLNNLFINSTYLPLIALYGGSVITQARFSSLLIGISAASFIASPLFAQVTGYQRLQNIAQKIVSSYPFWIMQILISPVSTLGKLTLDKLIQNVQSYPTNQDQVLRELRLKYLSDGTKKDIYKNYLLQNTALKTAKEKRAVRNALLNARAHEETITDSLHVLENEKYSEMVTRYKSVFPKEPLGTAADPLPQNRFKKALLLEEIKHVEKKITKKSDIVECSRFEGILNELIRRLTYITEDRDASQEAVKNATQTAYAALLKNFYTIAQKFVQKFSAQNADTIGGKKLIDEILKKLNKGLTKAHLPQYNEGLQQYGVVLTGNV